MDLDPMNDQPRDQDGFIVLKRTYSDLWQKGHYLTSRTKVMDRIYEYDIRSANTSSMRSSGKFSSELMDMLESMPRDLREKTVGKMIQKDKKVWKIISTWIKRAREQLFRANGIQDADVLAIKNDAVFIIGRKLKYTKFGFMEFRLKGQYSMYQFISKIEFYYDGRRGTVDLKGVNDKILEHPDHQDGMLKFFVKVFRYVSRDQIDELREYLLQFAHDYKAKKLPHQYYRELNKDNLYRTDMEIAGFVYNLDSATDQDLDIINPVYNYKRFILPILQLYL